MRKGKTIYLNIMSLLCNLAIIGITASVVIIYILTTGDSGQSLFLEEIPYFGLISMILVAISSLFLVPCNIASIGKGRNKIPTFIMFIRMAAVVMLTISAVAVIISAALGFQKWGATNTFPGLCNYLIVPIIALVSFIFFELETKMPFSFWFLASIPTVVYSVVYIILVSLNVMRDFYFEEDPLRILYVIILMAASVILSCVLWLLNKVVRLIFIGYTYSDADVKEVSEEAIEQQLEAQEIEEQQEEQSNNAKSSRAEKEKKTATNLYKNAIRFYHISRTKPFAKDWKVKLENGERALKIFPTQKEAIDYAKELTKTQGGYIIVHSIKGRMRKA